MRITHIKIQNWKNFRDVNVDLGDRIFIVGPNAAGKSNFLDVFKFLHDIAKQGGSLYTAIESRGGISKIRCLAARSHPEIEITVHLEDTSKTKWIYSLCIKQEPHGLHKPYVHFERVLKNGRIILNRPEDEDYDDHERLYQTYLENVNMNTNFREIAKTFEAIRYLHLVPQLVRFPQYFSAKKMPEDPYGQNFLELLAKTPEKTRGSRLGKIEKILKIAVPQLTKLSFIKDNIGLPHLEALYSHWRPKAGKQREDQFSDGTLRLIGLLWAILETRDALLLLEEPELSLNPGIISQLPNLIYKLQKNQKTRSQLFISTHSYDLLSDKSIEGEEVLLLTPHKEGTSIELASSFEEIRLLLDGGMSIGDAVLPKITPIEVRQHTLSEYI